MVDNAPRRRVSRWTVESVLMTLPFLAFGLVLFFTLLWMGEGSVLVGLLLILVAATVLFFIWGNRRSAAGKVF